MLKKTITYTDYNGESRTEDFYFNLTKAEIMEMEMSTTGGLAEKIQRIVAAKDTPEIVKIFKDLIVKSYGINSPDGKRHMKVKPDGSLYADEFVETTAYSNLFMKLATDSDAAAKFINGIIPSDAAKKLEESKATHPALKG